MRTVAIIQARVGSSRLPNKVFADICGKPMLLRVVERARRAATLDDVVVATSLAEADYRIVQWCQASGVRVYRGGQTLHQWCRANGVLPPDDATARNDVLGRYYDVAWQVSADVIVRLTADCPLLDPRIVDEVVAALGHFGGDYASNVEPPPFPDGLDVEVFTADALRRAYAEARLPSEREHVTPWMRANLRTVNVVNDIDLSALRWTVDDARDLAFVCAVYAELGEAPFGMAEVLALLERRPELAELNAGIRRNEGYELSLKEDGA